jgi:hypothetical protein
MEDALRLETLESLKQELLELLRQRTELDTRIQLVQRSVAALAALCEKESESADVVAAAAGDTLTPDDISLTDAIRGIIRSNFFGAIAAPAIRDRLVAEGFDPEKYANFLTVIHNTLRRLERQGEIKMMRGPLYNGWMSVPSTARGNPYARLSGVTTADVTRWKDLEGAVNTKLSGVADDEKGKKK